MNKPNTAIRSSDELCGKPFGNVNIKSKNNYSHGGF